MLKKAIKRRKNTGWYEITTYAHRIDFQRGFNAVQRYCAAEPGGHQYRFQEVSAYA